jgi:hypothetical protein
LEQQAQESPQASTSSESRIDFRVLVDAAIVFGCIPALVLNIIMWAIATAFPKAGVLPSILALLITLLLALMAVILLVRYVDVCYLSYKASMETSDDGSMMVVTAGAGIVCGFLVVCAIGCLSVAGALESWHYTLMSGAVLLVGYQTWRVFLGR